jgi:hypothetical protein
MISCFLLFSSEWITRQSLEPSTQNHGIGSFSMAGVPGTRDSWYEGQFLTKNRLGLRFANFANHMFPFKLFHVRLHLYGLRGEPEVLITFLRDLQDATLARARDESIACFGCRESAVQEGMQLVANIGGRPLQCGICRHHFCRHGSCLTSTMDCNWCGILSCETCKQVEQAIL